MPETPIRRILLASALIVVAMPPAQAAEMTVLTTGAYLPVVSALAPLFEARTHEHVSLANDTAGAVLARARAGAAFDLIILTPPTIADLATAGIVEPASSTDLAQVGVGVVVKSGTPPPDISTVEAFRNSLLNARSVAYIDPASGGSSGIYVAQLLRKLGIADQIAAHAVLVQGGRVADHIARGEAELGIHQISEILPVAGVTLVGPLPAAIQSETIYTGAVSQSSAQPAAARSFLALLAGPEAAPILAQKGMAPVQPPAHP
jgi:molybdate transport system substrate-binding protein